ncbi:D-tagatose-bisphosphate aldolase, class II, non-catalytic subunit [Aureimonas sp. ME7]|uniref:D-tagatose-bisphosphate aldolase, class II, non-catalytic subunit n=1 Tax=Aureimonas sp. ME7 TaxID=2744252 RepID=UPI0015F7037F|nr:D-tagatose-bisphosphate aldolase, class II, non-catalytic subunit [Aureimonas sp. ME7]
MSTAADRLRALPARHAAGEHAGIASICSAHPLVIEATLRHGLKTGRDVLIEATCNQVNQDGGYTGMTPADFRRFIERIAATVGFPPERLILGGDHLGPNPWKHLSAAQAMAKAEAMIEAYAAAGFAKLHLDASMGCAGELPALADEIVAERAAQLAARAEAAVRSGGLVPPVYVIGTEVPVPGGATHALDHLEITDPAAVRRTIEVHEMAFRALGLEEAFSRAIAVVVQPGVEFGHSDIVVYQPSKAEGLTQFLRDQPRWVFEAHSTDYQPGSALRSLVGDGFAILKVGPWATFALREALYGLSAIADILHPAPSEPSLPDAMEALMQEEPGNWRNYCHGSAEEQHIQRHFSYSDRIRYYWPDGQAQEAVERLMRRLGDRPIPVPLVGQHLGKLHAAVASGALEPTARELLLASVTAVLDIYDAATRP